MAFRFKKGVFKKEEKFIIFEKIYNSHGCEISSEVATKYTSPCVFDNLDEAIEGIKDYKKYLKSGINEYNNKYYIYLVKTEVIYTFWKNWMFLGYKEYEEELEKVGVNHDTWCFFYLDISNYIIAYANRDYQECIMSFNVE